MSVNITSEHKRGLLGILPHLEESELKEEAGEWAQATAYLTELAVLLNDLEEHESAREVAILGIYALTKYLGHLRLPYIPETLKRFSESKIHRHNLSYERISRALEAIAEIYAFDGTNASVERATEVIETCKILVLDEGCSKLDSAALLILLALNRILMEIAKTHR